MNSGVTENAELISQTKKNRTYPPHWKMVTGQIQKQPMSLSRIKSHLKTKEQTGCVNLIVLMKNSVALTSDEQTVETFEIPPSKIVMVVHQGCHRRLFS